MIKLVDNFPFVTAGQTHYEDVKVRAVSFATCKKVRVAPLRAYEWPSSGLCTDSTDITSLSQINWW